MCIFLHVVIRIFAPFVELIIKIFFFIKYSLLRSDVSQIIDSPYVEHVGDCSTQMIITVTMVTRCPRIVILLGLITHVKVSRNSSVSLPSLDESFRFSENIRREK